MAVKFNIIKDIKMKKPILIEGFPGMGLVGTISASFLADKLDMELVGYITSENFPPLAAIHNHTPLFPARLYASKKHNLIVLISEFIVPMKAVYNLSNGIYEFAKKKKVSQIISLGAIVQKSSEDTVFAVASDYKLLKNLEKHHKVQVVKDGVTTGVTGVLLALGAVEKFPVISLLAQASADYMDPRASVSVLEVLKDHLGLEFDTLSLEQDAHQVESKMKDLMLKAKKSTSHYNKTVSDSVATDLDGMYR